MMKRLFSLLLTSALLFFLTACGSSKPVSVDIFAMDTYMSLVAYGKDAKNALDECSRTINHLENLLSRTRKGSDVWCINSGDTISVDPTTVQLVQDAQYLSRLTGGAFDITVAPLVELWAINTEAPHVPTAEEIGTLLPLVGSDGISVTAHTVSLVPGAAIDLGGIAKGYASDMVKEIFENCGIESGSVSLGGNVYVHGTKPDGKPWNVAIQDPQGNGYAVQVSLSDAFVVTSGGYQRYFTAPDGTVYQHILDPKTGCPAESDLLSVSIIGTCGEIADAYSTALYVMGEAGAIDFRRSHNDFDMILITTDGRVLYTPDLVITEEANSGYVYEEIA